jgi:uncharacterized protein (DUF736 family)
MRGLDERNGSLFSYVSLEERIPTRHPLRKVAVIVNDVNRQRTPTPLRPGRHHHHADHRQGGPQPADFRVLSKGVEIGAGWLRLGQMSGKEYVSLSISAPELGSKTLYANLGRAAGETDPNVYALIWNPRE